jgi:predicted Ser/Thr protein kinase
LVDKPSAVIRNVFQLFHDMIKNYIEDGVDEYPGDPESIRFMHYDLGPLFVEGSDNPFFADRLFANRLMSRVDALRQGAQQNKIYIFQGPHGCGKSTFLNNLLRKFEEYANLEEGSCYETVWRLDRKLLGNYQTNENGPILEKVARLIDSSVQYQNEFFNNQENQGPAEQPIGEPNDFHDMHSAEEDLTEDYIEVPCPSHDHPILMIPKKFRRPFFDDLFLNDEFKWKLFTDKEYDWVFRDNPCTICSSIYNALLHKLRSPLKVFQMIFVRQYRFNRRIGEGVSVFNPGDKPMRQVVLGNPMLQRRINSVLKDSNQVKYIFSKYAKTHNGIYALMDIKSHNQERLIDLHNIISEGVHKVEDIEENVNSLFVALMNPEDAKNIEDIQSFSDRIEYINIPYVLDLRTEVEIYRNIFGRHIDQSFLPRVLHNFARVIISTRLNTRSEALLEWIVAPAKYRRYCDENLQLLKMEIYTGNIPKWLLEKDVKRFTAKRRRRVIAESENEGLKGLSGRDSIKIFNEFFSTYANKDSLINMSTLCNYFTKSRKELGKSIPKGFLDSLTHMYNYTVLQEVKESLFNYNEEQIQTDLQNYLFAINFEIGSTEKCTFTEETLEITEDFLQGIERKILGTKVGRENYIVFRKESQKEYASKTLTQEIMVDGQHVTETKLYHDMHQRYIHNLKEKVLEPFLENENFRRAIKDYGKEDFKTYDKKIREDITFMINNLCEKRSYAEKGAKEVCIYVIDADLAKKYENP